MRGQERIPLHDHVDNNSGGRLSGGSIGEVGGGGAGGTSSGTAVHAVEGPLHNTAETNTALVLHPDGAGGVVFGVSAGGDMMPYYIPLGETFTVPLYRQGLYSHSITVDGALVIDGVLEFVS